MRTEAQDGLKPVVVRAIVRDFKPLTPLTASGTFDQFNRLRHSLPPRPEPPTPTAAQGSRRPAHAESARTTPAR